MIPILDRRGLFGLAAGLVAGAALPAAAVALTVQEAETLVNRVIVEVRELIDSGAPVEQQAARFREVFEQSAATRQIARFVMGAAWRDMNPSQQDAFEDAFLDYVSRIYVNILADYKGETIAVSGSRDFGDKGVLVTSYVHRPGQEDTTVEWLVSDRGGDGPKLIDLVVEGVSLLQSQRQEFAAKLEKRNGDIDLLISDLRVG